MKKELIDSLASGINTGGTMELTDVVIVPHDPQTDAMVKILLSVFIGLFSPMLNDFFRGLKTKREAKREKKRFARKTEIVD